MSNWFRRVKRGIETSTKEKKETPDGLWHQCTKCKKPITVKDLVKNSWVCPKCEYHEKIGSEQYFHILYDEDKHTLLFENINSADPLNFVDSKPYPDRIVDACKKTGLNDAVRVAVGKINGKKLVTACMDFKFIGGSMGSVVGEKIARAIDYAREHKYPLLIISKSGGARMMESSYSLMQMAKTSAKLALLSKDKIPYISLMTDPTTGGVTASFAMLGDFNIAEPESLIGFAGPRVIKETIGKDLPKGFQRAEFLLEKGFLDYIVNRKVLKQNISNLMSLVYDKKNKKKETEEV
ncbi:MAG: acetyl-CoA carboxylase carboxyltransferase subunit beta [Bacteroidia bacterium]|nr:acetyl-CoA carboxylase carboxyltransferase subunit beta [Bacteroidia bacterium]